MSEAVPAILSRNPGLVDYVEVPFERLAHTPDLVGSLPCPVILHCASLSLAGNLPPAPAVVKQLQKWIGESATPWLGEHLAFVSMSGDLGPSMHEAFAPSVDQIGCGKTEDGLFNIGYTVSPQYSREILDRVIAALDHWTRELKCQLLIENGPVYFEIPGSEMTQGEFFRQLCSRRKETRLLMDLAHLACTAANTGEDAGRLLAALPLDRVDEVHLSGAQANGGVVWDDHARPIDTVVFELLEQLLSSVTPRAITIEYNWDPDFPVGIIESDIKHVRTLIGRGRRLR